MAHGLLGKLSRVDPQFGQVTKTLDVAGSVRRRPWRSEAVPSGRPTATSTLARVDPVEVRLLGQGLAASPAGIVFAAGARLGRQRRRPDRVSASIPPRSRKGRSGRISVGERPPAIAFGDGAIWVANSGDDTVTRIDPATYATSTIPVGHGPAAIAFGDGAVWVAESGGTISRIDPATRRS